jgi:hypothetical protein
VSEKQRLTITRALKELKLLDARITKKIGSFHPMGLKQKRAGEMVLDTFKTVNEFNSEVSKEYQSINDIIERRRKLKQAIAISNATTKVTIAGQEMTVIEALESKTTAGHKKLLMDRMSARLNEMNRRIALHQDKLDANVDKMIDTNLSKDRKADEEEYKKIVEPFMADNKLTKVDPIDVEKEIKKIEEYLEIFTADVDICLSESNSKTEIEI